MDITDTDEIKYMRIATARKRKSRSAGSARIINCSVRQGSPFLTTHRWEIIHRRARIRAHISEILRISACFQTLRRGTLVAAVKTGGLWLLSLSSVMVAIAAPHPPIPEEAIPRTSVICYLRVLFEVSRPALSSIDLEALLRYARADSLVVIALQPVPIGHDLSVMTMVYVKTISSGSQMETGLQDLSSRL